MGFAQVWDQIEHDIGFNEHNMRRDRPYNGQPQTITGARGATEIRGITFRDLRDCFVRAVLLSSHGISPAGLYDEATKGEAAAICENDLYGWDLNKLDPMAVAQNLACEIEKLMGIYPNVPALTPNAALTGHRPKE